VAFAILASVSLPVLLGAQKSAGTPTPAELREAYARADRYGRESAARAFKLRVEANWIEGGRRFWYRNDLAGDRREFVMMDAGTGKKSPAFDHARLAEALGTATGSKVTAESLPFRTIEFLENPARVRFDVANQPYEADLATYAVTKGAARTRPRQPNPGPWRQNLWEPQERATESPDGNYTARIRDGVVVVKPKSGEEFVLSGKPEGTTYHSRLFWTPDSKRVISARVTPGDRKQVYLFESTPADGGPAKVMPRAYDRPGDKVDTFDLRILNVEARTETPVKADVVDYGELPAPRWRRDKRKFTYEKMDRGYGRWRVMEVDSVTGEARTLVDDDPTTFFDSTSMFVHYCRESDDIVWRSERDGWGHLYLTDGEGRIRNQITKGPWVVREVVKVDEAAKEIVFQASGREAGEDPYFIHYYRVNFDGSGLTLLTPGRGNHSAQFSPDGKTLIDTYSAVNQAPLHVLRRASDGRPIAEVERADLSSLLASGWRVPEPFVAKGRDGKTDIYGVVFRPSNFDPNRKYPVIEDIYAGPHDSFVPKSFSASHYDQSLAELGFIVVKIDGMGTRNRGKAFHDVAYKNIADAGFPDRILWMKELAKRDPAVDLSRVGVFGTSAGGQSSTGALLFHPEFYKVAVSSCGCHDNRLDKIWWNEQWMGYPVGKEYEAQSNITNAAKLKGKLMLMVGELDDNVPPESTYRLVDALIKANKEFEFLYLPGLRHTAGGSFGERKRRDFFVRHLMGVEPPDWNGGK